MLVVKKICFLLLFILVGHSACYAQHTTNENYTRFVNPFIGTLGYGYTFAGPCLPHGFVKLGPDTKYNSGAAGYNRKKTSKVFLIFIFLVWAVQLMVTYS